MTLLKENGELDIDRINKLPLKEYMEEMGELTQEQVNEYISKVPLNESKEPVQALNVNCTIEDLLNRGCVNARDFINNL